MSDSNGIVIKELEASDLILLQRMLEEGDEFRGLSSNALGFEINSAILKERTIGDPDFDPALFLGAFTESRMVGCIMGVRRPWKNGRENQGWIKFIFVDAPFRRQGVGRRLLTSVEGRFAAQEANMLTFGSCAPNYLFPGVPRTDIGLRKLLEESDWKKLSPRTNLCADLSSPIISQDSLNGMQERLPGIQVSGARPEEQQEIESFVRHEFSRSWALELAPAFRRISSGFLSVARTVEVDANGRRIIGFAAMNCTNPNWFGPMGVAQSHRRKGVGRWLLLHNMLQARKAGVQDVILPWISQENTPFYTQAIGARSHCHFWKMEKVL